MPFAVTRAMGAMFGKRAGAVPASPGPQAANPNYSYLDTWEFAGIFELNEDKASVPRASRLAITD